MKKIFEKITSKMKKTEEKESDFSLFFSYRIISTKKKSFSQSCKTSNS
jgi:hypothetical protein